MNIYMNMAGRRVFQSSAKALVFMTILASTLTLRTDLSNDNALPRTEETTTLFCVHWQLIFSALSKHHNLNESRHIGFHRPWRPYRARLSRARIRYYHNSEATFRLLMSLKSGDISPNPGPDSKIKCLLLNARSLKSIHKDSATNRTVCNLQRFQDLVLAENADVVCVNETWLNQDISDTEILHADFTILRRDREIRSGGGVLIAVKTTSFKAVKKFVLESEQLQQLEMVSAELTTASDQKILFCSCYRPPDSDSHWIDLFNIFLNQVCDQFDNMVISGDFNLPNISWELIDSCSGVNELAFIDTLNDHFLSQLNNKPTRGNNILDLVITNVPNLVNVTDVMSPEKAAVFTDHCVVAYEFKAFRKAPLKTTRYVYDYQKGDFEGLRAALSAVNLSSVLEHEDINTDWQLWKDTFLAAVSDFIPQKRLKGRNPVPWITGTIINQIKKKEYIRRKLKQSPSIHLKQKFSALRAQVKRMLRESRNEFFGSLESDINSNPKRFWSILKQKSKSGNIPSRITMPVADGTPADLGTRCTLRSSAETPLEIANLFNAYFASVFTQNDSLDDYTYVSSVDPVMTELTFTVNEVQTILERLDVTKATGPDRIPAKLIRETATVIAPSLCKLFNKSLYTGALPQEWKEANVVPVFKKGDAEYAENYRPISLLPLVSKILERCVLNACKDRLSQMVTTCQHGFITGKSCTTNLVEVLDQIGSLLDKGSQIDMVYMDMSKAFDKVSHTRLLYKLRMFGFGGSLLEWFRSYLADRHQRVTVLGAASDPLLVSSGVPQGSILGPSLFLLYVNDLPDAIKTSNIAMFADDTKIFKEIKSSNDVTLLQADLNRLDGWSTASGLKFNESKCKLQSITRKIKPVASSYLLNGISLESVKIERDLGIWVSNTLSWHKQATEQAARANKLLGYIRRNTRHLKSTVVRKSVYLTLVRPHLAYASQVWAPQSIDLISRVERIQRRATKYILNLPFSNTIGYTSRLKRLSLLPVTYWHEYLDMTFFFKMTHNLVYVQPSVLPVARSSRLTRSSKSNIIKYELRKCRTSTYQKSYLQRTIRIWNTLADELNLSMDSLTTFKSVMLRYYFKSMENFDCDNPRTFKSVCLKCNSSRSLVRPISCCY